MSETTPTTPVRPIELVDNEVTFYNREGYLYLPGLLSASDAAAVREEVLRIMEAIGLSRERLATGAEKANKLRQTTQYLAGGTVDAVVNSEALRRIASRLMQGESTLYMPFTAVKSAGGGGRFDFHQDNQYTRFDGPGINIWIALNDMTPDNGCLQIVPRSHLRGTAEAEESADRDGHRKMKIEPDDFLPMRMRAGDAVAFTRLTVHGSGPNTTDQPRVAYAAQFHRNDVRATWNGETHLLTEHPRWDTAPKTKIEPEADKQNLDGH